MANTITITTAILLLTLSITLCAAEESRGMLCTDHPLHVRYPDLVPELMRSWSFKPNPGQKLNWRPSFYVPGYDGHSYNVPAEENPSDIESFGGTTRYHGLDLFVAVRDPKITAPDYITLHFQRAARVYLLVRRIGVKPDITGWTYEGTADLVQGDNVAYLGVARKKKWMFDRHVYVYSKDTPTPDTPDTPESEEDNFFVEIPSLDHISPEGNLGNRLHVLIGELGGGKSARPENLLRAWHELAAAESVPEIPAGGRCPDLLHAVWKVQGHDPADADTYNMSFDTYHPLWDPCYMCAYDHEHGSDVVRLMNYHPRFGYAALKNYEQDESHKGFKGHVLRVGDYHLYYQVHAHLSRPGRFTTRTHTVVIVVADAETHEIEVELTYKQDYGFASVKKSDSFKQNHKDYKGLLAVSPHDEEMKTGMKSNHTFGSRQMNFFDKDNPDGRFKRQGSKGTNEHWFCRPICSDVGKVKVDFKNPATGAVSGTDDTVVVLGKKKKDPEDMNGPKVMVQSTSHRRDVSIVGKRWLLSQHLCSFGLDHIHGSQHHGTFYTNPTAEDIYGTTGNNHMKQYFKLGFEITVTGKYNAVDTWAGLHEKGNGKGFMQDIGFAIDGSEN